MPMPYAASHDRQPAVAGQFYTNDPAALGQEVRDYLAQAERKSAVHSILTMAPHAGYYFSGAVAGATLGRANLAQTVLMLGPNHTGLGKPFAVWDKGRWLYPGGALDVDEELAQHLMAAEPLLESDQLAHQREHSLEVLVPFLAQIDPATRILPVAVAQPDLATLLKVGRAVGRALRAFARPVSMLVSSDMSHFVTHEMAQELDSKALDPAMGLNPTLFYETVRGEGISMCGVLPMTLALAAAVELGADQTEITAYATSGEVNGELRRVVGYAGMIAS